MTDTEKIQALVERVFGGQVVTPESCAGVFDPLHNLNHAFMVVEAMAERLVGVEIRMTFSPVFADHPCSCMMLLKDGANRVMEFGKTLQAAIVEAALAATEG